MQRTLRSLVAAMAVAATAACSDAMPTQPSAFLPDAQVARAAAPGQLTFSYTQSYDTSTPQTATGTTGAVDFTGSMTTGTPCVDVSAVLAQRGSRLIVTVSSASSGGICMQVVTHNNYTGRISDLAPGTYTLIVNHSPGGGRSTEAYSGTVTVS